MAFQDALSHSTTAEGTVSLKVKFTQTSEAVFLCCSTILLFLYVVSCNLAELPD